jgi:hypothetical protein
VEETVAELLKKTVFRSLAVVLGLAVPYLMAEGVYSVLHGGRAETSLGYTLYERWFVDRRTPDYDPRDPTTRVISRLPEIERMIGAFKANGVAIGNSPFKELKLEDVALNREVDGCWTQKPNLRKTVGFLHSNLFNPFDEMTYFYDTDRKLPAEITAFLRRYGFHPVQHTTNRYGERLTLPAVESEDKVLIAGDSVADGVMLDDAETLASRLQRSDPHRQYVNLGISGAQASDIVCALEKAARRYHGQIRELIYVFCENDFSDRRRYGTGDELIPWLTDFREREGIGRVIFLYSPFIYNVVPEVTRVRGHSHRNFPFHRAKKRRLLELAARAGFSVIDFTDVANQEQEAAGSLFAPLALYVDHTHYSELGVERLLPRLAALR